MSIKKRYLEITEGGMLGGSEVLYEFAKEIDGVLKKFKYLIPLFVLHTIIREIADSQEERAVEVKECEELYNKLNDKISKLLDDLEKEAEENTIMEDTINLIMRWIELTK